MSRRIARLLVTTIAVGFIVVGTGCATDDEIFKLRVEAISDGRTKTLLNLQLVEP